MVDNGTTPAEALEQVRALYTEALAWDLSTFLFTVYDHGTAPNAKREADAILAFLAGRGFHRTPATPERAAPVTGHEFAVAVLAERATHASRGYDAAHDAEHGAERLLGWAMHYAQRGEHIKSWSLVLAARELLARAAIAAYEGRGEQ